MKISYRWLEQYVSLEQVEPKQLAELMTRGGIEIEEIDERGAEISGVVVGYVKSKEKHPDADKLNVCKVDVGTGEELQIVCGATNVDAGQHVPVAVVGATLPGDFRIKRAKLRGVESQGMICSARELGINDKLLPKEQQEGILVLPADQVTIGAPILEVLSLNDSVLDLELTPNRSDCLSYIGTAYEVSALTGEAVELPEVKLAVSDAKVADHFKVAIETDKCAHYTARYIQNVRVAESPLWLQNRLIAAGVRPINNVVDVTNYVMLEYGQPLHAFDADLIKSGQITVREARAGEVLVTLDEQERKLDATMLVVTDGSEPIALAGVMGGASTEVTQGTTHILLESARFDGGTVRKTSRALGLRSESSLRFEKEVDPARVIPALDRAAALLAEIAGGSVAEGIAEAGAVDAAPIEVRVTLERINGYLGTELSSSEVERILRRLQLSYDLLAGEEFVVAAPSRRRDITRDVDIIEEVARLYGYDNLAATLIHGNNMPGSLNRSQSIRRDLRKRLSDAGLLESISYSFTSKARAALFADLAPGVKPVKLAMPMSEDRSVLRTTIIAQLLESATYNRNHKNGSVALFEIGNVFHTSEEQLTTLPEEKPRLAVLLAGNKTEAGWNNKAEAYDFYDAKGVLEALFHALGLSNHVRYEPVAPADFHPGRTAAVYLNKGEASLLLGYVGQLHPALQIEEDLGDVYVIEIDLAAVYEQAVSQIDYAPLPRYPAMERDIAVVVDEFVAAASLVEAVKEVAHSLLENVQVFDVFKGERLGAGKKSVAISLVYRHAERTLTDEEVTELHAKVIAKLEETFAAELRK